MGSVSSTEYREALDTVAREVVPDPASGGGLEGICHLLTGFVEIAVVDHTRPTPRVVVADGTEISRAIAVEARTGQGPSTDAIASGEAVVCRDLLHDRRWPRFLGGLGEVGLRRWAAVPFGIPGEDCVGAIVVAAPDPGIVHPDELIALTSMAMRSSLDLTARVAACREARAVLAADRVRVVSLAVGLVMAREGVAEDVALERLRQRSRRSECRLVQTATSVVAQHAVEHASLPRS